jgi:endonuclease/exonuclease/phosphatase family metal-dependent hydrolase
MILSPDESIILSSDDEFRSIEKLSTLPGSLRIASFNILAPQFSDKKGFPCVDGKFLAWENRVDRIVAEITSCKPNLICLQEMAETATTAFLTKLQETNPNFVMVGTLGYHGVVVIYDSSKFEINRISVQDKTLIPTRILILNIKTIDTEFILVNCHLKAKKKFEAFRKKQIDAILDIIGDRESMVVGDFNSFPDGIIIETLRKSGFLECRDETKYHIDLSDSYTTSKIRSDHYTAVSDYIFYRSQRYKPVNILSMPSIEKFPKGMPSELYPSDHLMIYCKF